VIPAPSAVAVAPPPAPPPPPPALPADPTPLTPFPAAEPESALKVSPTGYIEAYYAYNFNHPSNGITNYRGYDNRHNTFTLQNAALGASFEAGRVGGKVMLQIGSVSSTYYSGEPTVPGAGGANGSSPALWRYLQEAYVTYKARCGVLVTAGVMASPIGMQSFAVKDQWAWSRSNLGYALPKYHTGVKATYELTERLSATVGVFNGWNSILDDNDGKSVEGHVTYRVPDRLLVQVLYFGGVERPAGAPEGQYWRHHFDAVGQVELTSWLQARAQADYGFEPNRFGTASWAAGELALRAKATKWLSFTVRGDRFHENLATTDGRSTPLFWEGIKWVSSGTATAEVRAHENLAVRLEFRHDASEAPLYFTKDVAGDGSTSAPFAVNASSQNTLLLGATAWF
jgi:hypothetical protein